MSFFLAKSQVAVENESGKFKKELELSFKEAYKDKFHIGTALNTRQIMGGEPAALEVVKQHFNSVVAENCMKSSRIQPKEGEFNFSIADKFVEFGKQNDMHIHGHTLIWHSQAPEWFFLDKQGNTVSREVLIRRMRDHIFTVAGRYKGRIHSWDVVNEAILDDGSFRNSKFYEIIGEDFIKLAFLYAHEADPTAKLFYNDYSMSNPHKREGVVKMVRKLKDEGVPVTGIGMQGHIGMNHPDLKEFENSIEAFGDLGEVMITELDLSVLPSPWGDAGAEISKNFEYEDEMNPFPNDLPREVEQEFSQRYQEFMKLFLKHQNTISRVAFWGVNDGNSWKNNWPIKGRTDYPLLFDRQNNPKPVLKDIIRLPVKK